MSGGGKRSASFGYGALKGMRDMMVPTRFGPRPLLDQVDAISGVSGGSFPASYYGLHRDKTFGQFEKDFLYDDTNGYIFGVYLHLADVEYQTISLCAAPELRCRCCRPPICVSAVTPTSAACW
jgi:hypothetical protein